MLNDDSFSDPLEAYGPNNEGFPPGEAEEVKREAAAGNGRQEEQPAREDGKISERRQGTADSPDTGQTGTSGCVLMGPSQAGKTTLIYAMDQACSSAEGLGSRYLLEFVGGENVKKLSELPIRTIMEETTSIEATDQPTAYHASITATDHGNFWRPSRQTADHLVIRDGPGGALFPSPKDREYFSDQNLSDWEEDLLSDARHAATVILCVDANDPRSDQVSIYLHNILASLATDYAPTLEEPMGYRLLRRLRLAREEPLPRHQRRLAAKRFLLLFTKIDQLVARPLNRPPVATAARFPGRPTPKRIAARLSPLQVAYQCVGEVNLLRILNSLRPEAEFAIGLTSAWGFDPESGQAFMEGNDPLRLSVQPRLERVLAWRPFGVREALLFMVTGWAEGPLQRVTREDIGRQTRSRPLDIGFCPPPSRFLSGDKL